MNRRSFFARVAGVLTVLGVMPKRTEAEAVTPDPRGERLTCWHANPWKGEEAEGPYSVPRFFDERCRLCVDEAQWHGLLSKHRDMEREIESRFWETPEEAAQRYRAPVTLDWPKTPWKYS